MSRNSQTTIAAITLVAAFVLLAGMVYLTFIFPKVVQAWSAQDEELSASARLLVQAGNFCNKYGLLLLPLLLIAAAAAGVRLVATMRKDKGLSVNAHVTPTSQ